MHVAWLFIITLLVEIPIYGCFFYRKYKDWITWSTIITMNIFTWSCAMLLYGKGVTDFYSTEIGVIIIESFILKIFISNSWKKSIMASFCANVVTASLSFIV